MGCATTLRAMTRHRPPDIRLTLFAGPRGLPELRLREILTRIERERVDVLHLATLGPWAIAALYIAWRLRLPVVGSFDTTLPRGPRIHAEYVSLVRRHCQRLLVPSTCARRRLIGATIGPEMLLQWRPGVESGVFAPSKRSAALREQWQVSESRPAVLLCRPDLRRSRRASPAVPRTGSAPLKPDASADRRRRRPQSRRTGGPLRSGDLPWRCRPREHARDSRVRRCACIAWRTRLNGAHRTRSTGIRASMCGDAEQQRGRAPLSDLRGCVSFGCGPDHWNGIDRQGPRAPERDGVGCSRTRRTPRLGQRPRAAVFGIPLRRRDFRRST